MADRHPYVQSAGHLVQVVNQFRNSFPQTVDASTLKKLGCAPKNESYVVNTLRFLTFIDGSGSKTDVAGKVFSMHQDDEFQAEFATVVKGAYVDLFNLHGDAAWKQDTDGLITFFRHSDQSSAIVGKRQAYTFIALRSLAGHSDLPPVKDGANKTKPVRNLSKKPAGRSQKQTAPSVAAAGDASSDHGSTLNRGVGLTVRIEVNLPASGDQSTYDRIFRSIRENLLNV